MYGIWSASCAAHSRSSQISLTVGSAGAFDDDRHQGTDGVVHRRPDGPRRAVDMLQCRREPFEKADCPLTSQDRVTSGHPLDLAYCLLHALDGGLGPPAESVSSKARFELPVVAGNGCTGWFHHPCWVAR